MATLSTSIGLPVSIPLGVVSLTGVSVGGVTTALTKKYQKKLSKVMKLTDIIKPALPVFETCLSKALRNGKIDEEEFNLLEMFHLKAMNEELTQKSESYGQKPLGFPKPPAPGLNRVKQGNNAKLERKVGNTSPFIYLNRYTSFEKCFCFYLHYKILIKRFNSLLLTLSILSLTPVSLQNAF